MDIPQLVCDVTPNLVWRAARLRKLYFSAFFLYEPLLWLDQARLRCRLGIPKVPLGI